MSNKSLIIALLMTEGSPVGLKYLERMIEDSFFPVVVILSRTPKLTNMAVCTVRQRTKNKFVWKEMSELLKNQNIPVYYTDSHNSDITHDLLKKYKIDVAILGGTGIIKKQTLTIPKIGVINTHPGILPDYKGCSAVEWALFNNDPVGVTCHFVTPAIDAGGIIAVIKVKIVKGDDYYTVRLKAFNLQADVLLSGLKILQKGNFKNKIKKNIGGNYYSSMGKHELIKAKNILSRGLYGHYSA